MTSFLNTIFGNHSALYSQYLYTIQIYCLFVIIFVVSLCAYTINRYKHLVDKTFEDRVHGLRAKYSTTQRTGYD